jgi:hypothetical protein
MMPGPPSVLARPWASLGQSTVSDPGAPDRRADLKINNEPPGYRRARPGPAAWAGRRRRTTQVPDAFRGSAPPAGRRRPNRMSSRGRRFTGQRGEGGGKARTRTVECGQAWPPGPHLSQEASSLAPSRWHPPPKGLDGPCRDALARCCGARSPSSSLLIACCWRQRKADSETALSPELPVSESADPSDPDCRPPQVAMAVPSPSQARALQPLLAFSPLPNQSSHRHPVHHDVIT